jgi:hypothetical protein
VRTIVVSPVIGDAAASGNNLRQTFASISDASTTNPYLVMIEPGTFDLGTSPLQLLDSVDVQGAGEDATTIEGTVSASDSFVLGLANAELRSLRLEVAVTTAAETGLGASCDTRSPTLRDVTIDASNAAGSITAIELYECTTLLDTVTITGSTVAGSEGSLWGVSLWGGSGVAQALSIQFSCDTLSCVGVGASNGAETTVRDSTVTLSGSNATLEGIWAADGALTLDDVTVAGTGLTYGFLGGPTMSSMTLTIQSSTLGGSPSIAAGITESGVAATVDVATSELSGAVLDFGGIKTTFNCVDDYDGNFAPLGPTCEPLTAPQVQRPRGAVREVFQSLLKSAAERVRGARSSR